MSGQHLHLPSLHHSGLLAWPSSWCATETPFRHHPPRVIPVCSQLPRVEEDLASKDWLPPLVSIQCLCCPPEACGLHLDPPEKTFGGSGAGGTAWIMALSQGGTGKEARHRTSWQPSGPDSSFQCGGAEFNPSPGRRSHLVGGQGRNAAKNLKINKPKE